MVILVINRPTHFIPALDGLRALSVSLVLFDHLCISGSLPIKQDLIDLGNLGVRIFFIISGFLISTLLLREKETAGTISLKSFYVRRFFRIVPIWSCYLVGVLVILWLTHRAPPWREVVACLTFNVDYFRPQTVELEHLWSLGVEEKFYLLWPLLLVLVSARRAAWISVGWIVAAPLLRASSFLAGGSYEWLLWPFHHSSDAMAVGCLLALRSGPFAAWRLSYSWQVLLASLLVLGLAATYKAGFLYYLISITAMNFCIAAIIDALVSNPSWRITQVLNQAPIVFVGSLSYGFYLFQQPLLFRRKLGLLSVFPVNLVALFLLVTVGFYLVEQPARRYGSRLAKQFLAATSVPDKPLL